MTGEQKVLESADGDFVVSSHRVRMTRKRLGSSEHTSIPIESITSYEVDYDSNPLFLGLALVGVGIVGWGLAAGAPGAALIGGIAAAVSTLLFFLWRERTLSVASPSDSIDVRLKGVPLDEAIDVIEEIETARRNRLEQTSSEAYLRAYLVPLRPSRPSTRPSISDAESGYTLLLGDALPLYCSTAGRRDAGGTEGTGPRAEPSDW